jgi:prevent-host-death family protein
MPEHTAHIEHIKSFDVKTHLSSLLNRVEAGEQFIITRHNHEVARLVPIKPQRLSVSEVIDNWQKTKGICRLDLPGGSAALKTEGRR